MMEQLISLSTAKLAKRNSFNLYCPYSYYDGILTGFTPGYRLEDGTTSENDYWGIDRYYAPTQSLLQKWIREKHGINTVIQQTEDNTFDGYLQGDFKDSEIDGEFAFGEKYEECLELLLIEALEYIKQ